MSKLITTKFLHAVGCFVIVAAMVVGAPRTADAVECQFCQGKSPRELLDISIFAGSSSLKSQIRSYLAETYPNTGYGFFGKAWVADANGASSSEVIALYEKAVELDPTIEAAWTNLGYAQEGSAALEAWRQGLELRWFDPIFVRAIFFRLKDQDQEAAFRFLDEADKGEYTAPFGVDFVRGVSARTEGNLNEADRFFQQSLDKGGNFEVLEGFVNNRLALLSAQNAGSEAIVDLLRFAVEWSESNHDAQGMMLVAKILVSEFDDRRQAVDYYRKSYEMFPTPEAATAAFGTNANFDFDDLYEFLLKAESDFPDNHEVLKTLRWANSNFQLNADLAERNGLGAIKAAATNKELTSAVNQLADTYSEIGTYEAAQRLFETYLGSVGGSSKRNMLGAYVDSRIAASDFSDAARLLEKMVAQTDVSQSWLAQRRDRIDAALRLEAARERFFESYPFLRRWEQQFGESLRVAVEFDTNKSDLRPEALPLIDQAAQALMAPGAEDYVFLIEGHTDSAGANAVNIPLSKARAAAVESHLINNFGLDDARIQTIGFGPRNPVAPNDSEVGKQTNRRVEIRPYGNVAAPRISVNAAMDSKNLRISRDGRIAVSGSGPLEVWDIQRMVRLHELPRGLGGAISPNGRYFATGSSFSNSVGKTYQFLIYDLRTGHVVSQLHLDTDIDEISWSPFSEEVAWTDRNGYLKVMKVGETRPDRVGRIATLRGSGEMIWLNSGRFIVASEVQSSNLVVFDAQTLKVIGNVAGPGWVMRMGQTHDGGRLVTVNNKNQMMIWDTQNWDIIASREWPNRVARIIEHPSKPWVLINSHSDSQMHLMDLSNGELLRHKAEFDGGLSINFTPDGTQFVTNASNGLSYYDLDTFAKVRTLEGLSHRGKSVKIIPQRDLIVSRDDGGSHFWSLKTGRRVHSLDTVTLFPWQDLSGDGRTIVNVAPNGELTVFNTETFEETIEFQANLHIDTFEVSDKYVILSGVTGFSFGSKEKSSSPMGQVIVLDRVSLTEISRIQVDIITEPTRYGDIYRPKFSDVAVSDQRGELAVATRWQDGYGESSTKTRLVRVYDLVTGEQTASFRAENRIDLLKFENDGQELWTRGDRDWLVYDPSSGTKMKSKAPTLGFEIELSDGRILSWLFDYVRLGGKEVYFPGSLRDLEVYEGRNLAVGITTGNEIVIINLEQMKRELTIVPKRNGEWIAYAPDGGYSASLNGTEGVFWSLGDNYLSFEALKSRFERPDLIRKRLEAITNREALPEGGPDVNVEVFEAPYKVSLASERSARIDADTYLLELIVVKDSVILPHPEIEYILNGRRILKSRGFDEDAVFEGTETLGISRRFDLKPGRNIIEASLVWQDARLSTQRVEIIREENDLDPNREAGNNLWFFGVGVSDYEITTQNLNYAHRDAEELETLLKAQEGVLFKKVNTRVLTNTDATERQVRIAMNEFLDQAKPNDVIVLFIAGHGVTNDEQELFFMTHDADIDRPFTGMAVDRFRSYLDNRPINQNALFLLDICHSGAADGRVVAEDAVQTLTKGTGAIVFASSSGSQQSFEDETFGGGHGAFTAALLEGLRGLADNKVGDRDGFNSLQEIVVFTSARVPEMTEGQQRPSFPVMSNSLDFPLSLNQN